MQTYLLLDTSAWLGLAQDAKLRELAADLDRVVRGEAAKLVVPDLILDEFQRNRAGILEQLERSFDTAIRNALRAEPLLERSDRERFTALLDHARQRIPAETEKAADTLRILERLLAAPETIRLTPSQEAKTRVVERAMAKRAPFHRNKNSVADAVIAECFREFVNGPAFGSDDEAVLVTLNTKDFSDLKDERLHHPDFADIFTTERTRYSINLAEVLATLEPKKDWSNEIAAFAEAVHAQEGCPFGGAHEFREGANLRSQYGGLTWHEWCSKCHFVRDTGDPYD